MKMGELDPLVTGGKRRIAVIGGGISGLAAAWLLSRKDHVTLFEAAGHVGGHTHTVDVEVDGLTFPVDTGFLVFNRRTYPNLCAMFGVLGVKTVESEMSFGVSLVDQDLEWAGSDLNTVFAQRSNLLKPAMWRMLADILRFNREATRMAVSGESPDLPLGAYLAAHHYGTAFRNWYLLPMAAAIWSCPTRAMLDYPLSTFVRFCHNHGLLQVLNRPTWMTVQGGGREYVRKILDLLDDVRVNNPVQQVVRDESGVWIQSPRGTERFDQVVFACHSDQALAILGPEATVSERRLLAAVRYQPNRAVLHTDASLLPRRKSVWSAWNYLAGDTQQAEMPVAVSYLINRLQPLPVETPVIVSLNPFREPDPAKVMGEFDYAHPIFDQAAVEAQGQLDRIQGAHRTWFAGAWTGYGFHEDGLKSALNVVERLGGVVPWRDSQFLQTAASTRLAELQ